MNTNIDNYIADDIDMLDLYDKIIKKLDKNENYINKLKLKHSKLNNFLKSTTDQDKPDSTEFSYTSLKHIINNNINAISKTIEKMADSELEYFIIETEELIHRYRELINKKIVVDFMSQPGSESKDDGEKRQIIQKFLEIARKYDTDINIDPDYYVIHDNVCESCGDTDNFTLDHNSLYYCLTCGAENDKNITDKISYTDLTRISSPNKKYKYNRTSNFQQYIYQYQGKQNFNVSSIVKQVEDYVHLNKIDIGDDNTPRHIKYQNVTRGCIQKFLKDQGYNKYYDHINLIYHKLTTKPLDDISYLENQLLQDFDMLVDEYFKYYKDNNFTRRKFVSSSTLLYQLLRKNKHYCSKDDFVTLKSQEVNTLNDDVISKLFKILGWNYDKS